MKVEAVWSQAYQSEESTTICSERPVPQVGEDAILDDRRESEPSLPPLLPSAPEQGFPNSIAHVRESLPEALCTQGAEGFCEQELSLILLMRGKELQRRFSHVLGFRQKA